MNSADGLAAESASTKESRRAEMLLILSCSLVSVPLVLNKGLYFDDWRVFWTFWVEGPSQLFQLYRATSHIGHWPPVALLFGIGGGYVGVLAKAFAVVFHVANAVLFYRIFKQIKLTSEISVWVAALYVLSPFYYGRGILVLSVGDFFLSCYLVSIWLLCYQRRLTYIAAFTFFVLSLGHETFIFLEPLRVLFVYETRKNYRITLRACLLFWAVAITFAILRATFLKTYGYFAGYNQLLYPFRGVKQLC